jgi:hypothetical protein
MTIGPSDTRPNLFLENGSKVRPRAKPKALPASAKHEVETPTVAALDQNGDSILDG